MTPATKTYLNLMVRQMNGSLAISDQCRSAKAILNRMAKAGLVEVRGDRYVVTEAGIAAV